MMTYEDLLSIKSFLQNHRSEIDRLVFELASSAAAQLEYWFLDGKPSLGFDPEFYKNVLSAVCFEFVSSNDDNGWYNHPEDFPAFYWEMLFN